MTFYRCKHCGQIVAIVKETKVPIKCCGEDMEEIIPGTTDAAVEKHVPVLSVSDGKAVVTVGSVAHPMLPEHYIEWIILETTQMEYKKKLKPGDKPVAAFILNEGDEPIAAFEYCNLHRLWKKEI